MTATGLSAPLTSLRRRAIRRNPWGLRLTEGRWARKRRAAPTNRAAGLWRPAKGLGSLRRNWRRIHSGRQGDFDPPATSAANRRLGDRAGRGRTLRAALSPPPVAFRRAPQAVRRRLARDKASPAAGAASAAAGSARLVAGLRRARPRQSGAVCSLRRLREVRRTAQLTTNGNWPAWRVARRPFHLAVTVAGIFVSDCGFAPCSRATAASSCVSLSLSGGT